jgi:hypothetical protein
MHACCIRWPFPAGLGGLPSASGKGFHTVDGRGVFLTHPFLMPPFVCAQREWCEDARFNFRPDSGVKAGVARQDRVIIRKGAGRLGRPRLAQQQDVRADLQRAHGFDKFVPGKVLREEREPGGLACHDGHIRSTKKTGPNAATSESTPVGQVPGLSPQVAGVSRSNGNLSHPTAQH